MSRKTRVIKPGRLALRVEGDYWNAYFAAPETMENAVHLGSIMMAAVVDNDDRKQAFMALMQDVVADFIEGAIGQRPTWPDPPEPAPESERSGNA